MTADLKGRVALVTGAGRGLGEIMAQVLASQGAAVALTARSQAQIERVASDIVSLGGRAFAVSADVTVRAQVEQAVRESEAALGPIDILINNAGKDEPFGPVGYIDPDEWWSAQAVHVLGPMYMMTAVVPGMAERGRGHVINVCSMAGTVVQPNMSAYAVGKCTEIRLAQHVAAERAAQGVAVFAIEPGTILTGMADNTLNSEEAQRWVPDGIAYLKSITPEQSEASRMRLEEMVLQLVSGRYDALSGRYLEPTDNFDELLEETNS